mmetsp:Transcript_13527/g.33120  ORF Transcript_13527/g.33120 Transcript_13527/m.33120 type:complete len:235 (-) Transcript_13527:168-872(-)
MQHAAPTPLTHGARFSHAQRLVYMPSSIFLHITSGPHLLVPHIALVILSGSVPHYYGAALCIRRVSSSCGSASRAPGPFSAACFFLATAIASPSSTLCPAHVHVSSSCRSASRAPSVRSTAPSWPPASSWQSPSSSTGSAPSAPPAPPASPPPGWTAARGRQAWPCAPSWRCPPPAAPASASAPVSTTSLTLLNGGGVGGGCVPWVGGARRLCFGGWVVRLVGVLYVRGNSIFL